MPSLSFPDTTHTPHSTSFFDSFPVESTLAREQPVCMIIVSIQIIQRDRWVNLCGRLLFFFILITQFLQNSVKFQNVRKAAVEIKADAVESVKTDTFGAAA